MAKYDTKKVVDECIHYYDIVSEKFAEDDMLSPRIVKYYKYIISQTKYTDNDLLNKAMLLDKAVYEYLTNSVFKEEMNLNLKHIDKQTDLGDFLREQFQNYEAVHEKKEVSTRWI